MRLESGLKTRFYTTLMTTVGIVQGKKDMMWQKFVFPTFRARLRSVLLMAMRAVRASFRRTIRNGKMTVTRTPPWIVRLNMLLPSRCRQPLTFMKARLAPNLP